MHSTRYTPQAVMRDVDIVAYRLDSTAARLGTYQGVSGLESGDGRTF